MTKESILKRLFFNNQITLDELLVLVDAKYKENDLVCKNPDQKSQPSYINDYYTATLNNNIMTNCKNESVVVTHTNPY